MERGQGLEPDAVLRAAAKHGVRIARSTLRANHRKGIIPKPTTRSLGRGRGKVSEYPPETVAELVAAARMIGRPFQGKPITVAEVAEARRCAYEWTPMELLARSMDANINRQESDAERRRTRLVLRWLAHRARVVQGLPDPEDDEEGRSLSLGDAEERRPVVECARLIGGEAKARPE